MFRSSLFLLISIVLITMVTVDGKNLRRSSRQVSSTRKPVSVKICGLALVRMLDMVCTRARQLIAQNPTSSTPSQEKRQLQIDDDPYSHTLSFTDYAQFNDTLVGDCCLQACTLKTLLKYC